MNLVFLGGPHQICAGPATRQDLLTIWTEWFNSHIGPVEYVGNTNPADGLGPPQRLVVGRGGLIFSNGKPFTPSYVVINSRQEVFGTRLDRF